MNSGCMVNNSRQSGKLVTIVVPVFNTEERYLKKCFQSLSMVQRGLFEVVIVDDGSPKEYHHWLAGYINEFPFDSRIVWRENGGQNVARFAGADLAVGDYLFFLDSDDYINPRAFEECCNYLMEYEPDILAFNVCKVDPSGHVLEIRDCWTSGCASIGKNELLVQSDGLSRQIYRRETFLNVRSSLVTDVRIGEDMSSATLIAISATRLYATGAVVYQYVQRPSSMLHSPHGRINDIRQAMDEVLERADSTAIEAYHEEIEWLAILHVLYYGGMRLLLNTEYDSRVKTSYFDWMDERFAAWRSNHYLVSRLQQKGNPSFRLIVQGHWFFYYVAFKVKGFICEARARLMPLGTRQ